MQLLRTDSTLRLIQISVLVMFGVYSGLVAIGNIQDPETNLVFVEHVLRMDTTFERPALMSRSIESPILHRVAFAVIVLSEWVVSLLCLLGAIGLGRRFQANAEIFHSAKGLGLFGLGGGVVLWFFGFQVVGGEWFVSWQSTDWNALLTAFRISSFALLGLILLTLRAD